MIRTTPASHILLHSTRLLAAGDARAVTQHYRGLPAHDRYLRFCGSMSSQSIERLVNRCIVRHDHAFVGYSVGASLIGVAQLAPADTPATGSELALSVDPAFRRIGVATALTREAIALALERNITGLLVITAIENRPMIELSRKFGFRLQTSCHAIKGYLHLDRRDPISVAGDGAHP